MGRNQEKKLTDDVAEFKGWRPDQFLCVYRWSRKREWLVIQLNATVEIIYANEVLFGFLFGRLKVLRLDSQAGEVLARRHP